MRSNQEATPLLLSLGAGLALGLGACSSQTAIAITTVEDAAQGDIAPATDYATGPETGPEAGPEAGSEAGLEAGPDSPTVADALTISVRTLFSDGFDGGYEVNWAPSNSSDGPITNTLDGTNKIATLDSTQTDYARVQYNSDGLAFTDANITASMRIRIEQAPSSTRTVRLDVRQSAATANIFYAVGATIDVNGAMTKVSVFKKVGDGSGGYTICELAAGASFATPVAMNQWRTIKLTISGSKNVLLTASFEGVAMATFTDDCVSSLMATNGTMVPNGGCLADQTGIGIQVEKGIKASVDDVTITTP